MKKQIIVIHGGDSFKTYKEYLIFLKDWQINFKQYISRKDDWKKTLGKSLGKNYEVVLPDMPDKINAKYAEWKIWFEKFIPHLKPGVVLIGHSLGGLFLTKYLSKTKFPKKIRAVFLVAAPISGGDFTKPKNFKKIEAQARKIFLYHSKDDRIVPFTDFKKYQKKLKSAIIKIFNNKGHFNQLRFPELVKDIKNLYPDQDPS